MWCDDVAYVAHRSSPPRPVVAPRAARTAGNRCAVSVDRIGSGAHGNVFDAVRRPLTAWDSWRRPIVRSRPSAPGASCPTREREKKAEQNLEDRSDHRNSCNVRPRKCVPGLDESRRSTERSSVGVSRVEAPVRCLARSGERASAQPPPRRGDLFKPKLARAQLAVLRPYSGLVGQRLCRHHWVSRAGPAFGEQTKCRIKQATRSQGEAPRPKRQQSPCTGTVCTHHQAKGPQPPGGAPRHLRYASVSTPSPTLTEPTHMTLHAPLSKLQL